MKKVFYSAVIYDCKSFNIFMNDYLGSVFNQTESNFDLLLIVDNVEVEIVMEYINKFNKINKKIYVFKFKENCSPSELRKKIIEKAYDLDGDILIMSDFDETCASNRVEEVLKKIDSYAFVFNDFYIVDKNLNKIRNTTFFQDRVIPKYLFNWISIKSFNFIGFGSFAMNLRRFDYRLLDFPKDIQAIDWYVATFVLLNGGIGFKMENTYANYRQHNDNLVGFNLRLDTLKLEQGLSIKESHYKYFCKYDDEFKRLYDDIIELREYINDIGSDKYIKLINEKYDTSKFCWWENIKTKEELKYDNK